MLTGAGRARGAVRYPLFRGQPDVFREIHRAEEGRTQSYFREVRPR